jgi:hypothetical protein
MKEIDQCINIHAQHGDYELRLKYKLKIKKISIIHFSIDRICTKLLNSSR